MPASASTTVSVNRARPVGAVGQAPLLQQRPVRVDADAQRAAGGDGVGQAFAEGSDAFIGVRTPRLRSREANPRAASAAASSAWTRASADGSLNTAVPTETAEAPASTNCRASRPVRMPPMPRIGTLGQRLVHLPDAAQRHRPDRRPGQAAGDPAEHRPHRVGVDDQPEQRVDHREPVGAGVRDRAGDATMSVTSGLSLA